MVDDKNRWANIVINQVDGSGLPNVVNRRIAGHGTSYIQVGDTTYAITPTRNDPDKELRDRVIRQIDSNRYDNKLFDAFRGVLKNLRDNAVGGMPVDLPIVVDEGDIRIHVRAVDNGPG